MCLWRSILPLMIRSRDSSPNPYVDQPSEKNIHQIRGMFWVHPEIFDHVASFLQPSTFYRDLSMLSRVSQSIIYTVGSVSVLIRVSQQCRRLVLCRPVTVRCVLATCDYEEFESFSIMERWDLETGILPYGVNVTININDDAL